MNEDFGTFAARQTRTQTHTHACHSGQRSQVRLVTSSEEGMAGWEGEERGGRGEEGEEWKCEGGVSVACGNEEGDSKRSEHSRGRT